MSEELALAHQFLSTIENQRASWAARYEAWADQKALGEELRRSVRIGIVRLRIFHTVERSARRRRP